MNVEDLLYLGLKNTRHSDKQCTSASRVEKFRKQYGIQPETALDIYNDIISEVDGEAKIVEPDVSKFFVTLYWLKGYPTEGRVMAMFKIGSRMTFRKHNRMWLKALQALSEIKIIWDVPNDGRVLFASLDGVHCPINEPRSNPGTIWYSHKSNGPALTYQIVLLLDENKVLSVIGPYPAGNTDLVVFRKAGGISDRIPVGKRLIGDKGYGGVDNLISIPSDFDDAITRNFKNRARARQESFNKRIKDFKILRNAFRHANNADPDFNEHKTVFEAVCVIVQYDLKYRPLFNA